MSDSALEQSKARGVSPEEIVYDWLLEDDGKAILYVAAANYAHGNLDHMIDMVNHPDLIVGLGDGGAHYGLICDSSYPTFVLSHLTRDREGGRLSLPQAIRALTSKPAAMMGLKDRGLLKQGMKADLNVIDAEKVRLHRPFAVYDLPSGGRRIMQKASGYRATIVSGEIINRDDQPTDNLPGRLVRGTREAVLQTA